MEKRCTTCGRVKRLESFGRSKAFSTGYNSSCKICRAEYARKHREKKNIEYGGGPRLTTVTKDDWCRTYKFLTSIGYDVSKDIHEQFSKKYGLTYKERPYRNTVSHLPTDCLDGFDMANPPTDQ